MQETWVQSLGQEDSLEKEMATHCSTLAWKIPWMQESGRTPTVHGVSKSRTRLSDFTDTDIYLALGFPGGSNGIKDLPAVWETRVWSLGQEDTLEKRMATHSNIIGWRIPWTEEPGGLQSKGSQRVKNNSTTNTNTHRFFLFKICGSLTFIYYITNRHILIIYCHSCIYR